METETKTEKAETKKCISKSKSKKEGQKLLSIVMPACVGAIAIPFVASAAVLSTATIGALTGAICGASYLAGKKKRT